MTVVDETLTADIEAILNSLPSEAHRREVEVLLAAHAAQIEVEHNRARWLTDPVAWAQERVQVDPWSKQVEILESVRDRRRTVVLSCNDVGKSFVGATVIAWWVDCHPPGTAFVVSTAPTFPQVRAILWREVRGIHRKGHLPGRINNTEWIDENGDITGYGRKPADHDATGFLGIHARYVLVVIDEACGVPKALWDAVESITTNADARVLAIGNPDDPGTEFGSVASMPDLWNVISISAFDSPNFTGEQVSDDVAAKLVSREWVEERKIAWGEDSSLYISRVEGRFPHDVSDRAVPFSKVMTLTINRDMPPMSTPAMMAQKPVVLGLDVGGGGDYTVVRERRGPTAYRSWSAQTKEPEAVAAMIVKAVVVTGARIVNYDAGGIGWAMGTVIRQALKDAKVLGVQLNPINFGATSREPEKYANKRAEMVWGIGRVFTEQQAWYLGAMIDADTGEPNWEDTVAQLTDQKWSLGVGDRIKIEKKEDIIKRTGRSPDDADALLLAFCQGVSEPATIDRPAGQLPTGSHAVTRRHGAPGGAAQLPTRAGLTR